MSEPEDVGVVEERIPATVRMVQRADELERYANALDAEAREREQSALSLRARAERIRTEALNYRGAATVIERGASR